MPAILVKSSDSTRSHAARGARARMSYGELVPSGVGVIVTWVMCLAEPNRAVHSPWTAGNRSRSYGAGSGDRLLGRGSGRPECLIFENLGDDAADPADERLFVETSSMGEHAGPGEAGGRQSVQSIEDVIWCGLVDEDSVDPIGDRVEVASGSPGNDGATEGADLRNGETEILLGDGHEGRAIGVDPAQLGIGEILQPDDVVGPGARGQSAEDHQSALGSPGERLADSVDVFVATRAADGENIAGLQTRHRPLLLRNTHSGRWV